MVQFFKTKENLKNQEIRDIISDLKAKIGIVSAVVFLRTAPIFSIQTFIELGGLKILSELLAQTNLLQNKKLTQEKEIQFEIIEGLKAVMDTTVGIESLLREKDVVRNISLILDSEENKTKISILYILSILCSHSFQGYSLVIDAINHYKLVKREKQRFVDLVRSLMGTKDTEYHIAVFVFLNSLMTHCKDQTTKVFLQKEWTDLCIKDIINELKKKHCAELTIQMEIFEKEIKTASFDLENLDDPISITRLLSITLSGSDSYSSFTNILLDMLYFSGFDNDKQQKGWIVLEKMMKKSIQEDGEVRELNEHEVLLEDKVLKLKRKVNIYKKVLREEREKALLQAKSLEEKEKNWKDEMDLRNKQIEQLMSLKSSFSNLKEQSNHPSSPKMTPVKNNSSPRLTPMKSQNGSPKITPLRFASPIPVKNTSPKSVKVTDSPKIAPLQLFKENETPNHTPRPPPTPMGTPCPPPFSPGLMKNGSSPKLIPKLKTRKFHFDDLKAIQFNQSIFAQQNLVSESHKMMCHLNLDEIQNLFGVKVDTKKDVFKSTPIKKKTLIDQDRANKISLNRGTIRNLSNIEIRNAILERNRKILKEPLLKILKQIVPTKDELEILLAVEDPSCLTDAEKFLLTLNIPNLEFEIDSMLYKWRLEESSEKDITSVISVCKELKSEKINKFFTLVLAMGSILNGKSQKGFEITSLLKLNNMKSSDQKMTLLQYIIKMINENDEFKGLKTLKQECRTVLESKFDYKSIQDEFQEISAEFHKFTEKLTSEEHEKFESMQIKFKEMTTLVDEMSKYFACDFSILYDTMKQILKEFALRGEGFESKVNQLRNGKF